MRWVKGAGDGLTGGEGTFNMCYVLAGRGADPRPAGWRRARVSSSRRWLTYAQPPWAVCRTDGERSGEALGNFPAGPFTHMGLISAAFNLDRRLAGRGLTATRGSVWSGSRRTWGVADRRLGRSTEEQRFAWSGRLAATRRWRRLDPAAPEARPPRSSEALRDPESFRPRYGRPAAPGASSQPENPDAIPGLWSRGTHDGISFVRSLAAWHLGRLGPGHPGIEFPWRRSCASCSTTMTGACAAEGPGGAGETSRARAHRRPS